MKHMSYRKFGIMMIISFFVMYLAMFVNMDQAEHYHTSLTRIYMALIMVAPMAIIMIGMMGSMYPNRRTNRAIIVTAIVVFIAALTALRSQTPISDVQYMRAMIPHHSSAIMTSKHANIKDPEVKQLSEQIIQSQEREIHQMEQMLQRMK
ncbi:DUF305 domain-containing protein [Niabella ginsenosidivorans]|uniref:DUF305 domain-containing protein n=2 Tax=Niabella ginsenosidivorans TaxID=1176587 RepID=A0A1A9I296_9BACT|nr:DUF305 domain-containing protein [Niabella beijingensis]ANH81179.1 DUF305 domain-containing protein [Niabella ginsenosidivorans]MBZ4191572.1 DUF305 domain-containing protein [Niabella beijingensis]